MELSKEVIDGLNFLKSKIEDWLTKHNISLQLSNKENELLQKQEEVYKHVLVVLKETLSTVKVKGAAPLTITPLEQYYEDVIELGIKMNTGGSKIIAENYQKAIDNFLQAYEEATMIEKESWVEAKKEVQKSNEILKEKIAKAKEEDSKRQKKIPPGGYFRFIEGEKGDKNYFRLDWISKIANLNGESYHVGDDTSNSLYHGGTNRYIIELYKAEIDDVGKITFISEGTATSLTKKGIELFSMLNNPYLSNEEVGNKKFPNLVNGGVVHNNTELKWSITLWAPKKKEGEEVELPDWDDYLFIDLLNEFKSKCAKFRLGKDEASELKEKMKEAIKKQKELYKVLNTIKEGLEVDNKEKLQQQQNEINEQLKVWKKRINTYEMLIEPLDYKDCLRPPVTINIGMGYWTGAVLNSKQVEIDLESVGILERLRTYPNAIIQVTATFDHGSNPNYTANPTLFMDGIYSPKVRSDNAIPSSIVQKRDFLVVKAQNVANVILGFKGIKTKQVVPNIIPGDIGSHMGAGKPFGDQVTLRWINDGE